MNKRSLSSIVRKNWKKILKIDYRWTNNDNRRKKEAAMFAEKAPSKAQSLMDATNKVQDKSMADKSKPISVVNVGGSSGGSSNVVNNTYVNPPNMDATIRQLQNNLSFPARIN